MIQAVANVTRSPFVYCRDFIAVLICIQIVKGVVAHNRVQRCTSVGDGWRRIVYGFPNSVVGRPKMHGASFFDLNFIVFIVV